MEERRAEEVAAEHDGSQSSGKVRETADAESSPCFIHSFGSYPSGRLHEERAYTRGHLTVSASPRLLVHIYQEPAMSQALPDARAGEKLRGRFPGPSLKEGTWVSISQMKKHGASRG